MNLTGDGKKYRWASSLAIGAAIAVAAYILFFHACMTQLRTAYPRQYPIAHGGGAINGLTITNTLEAVENSIQNGVIYIELDLQLTADNQLVAAHDWGTFARQTGLPKAIVPDYKRFCESRVDGQYRPLDYRLIDSVFTSNPALILVTDKMDDVAILQQFLPRLGGRVLMECFSREAYRKVRESGYAKPMLSYANLIPGGINTTETESRRYRMLKFVPSGFALYRNGITTSSEADSVFASDRRVRFYYVDLTDR